MNATSLLFGERFMHMEGAIFDDGKAAEEAARALVDQGLERDQVEVVRPNDQAVQHKLEPEPRRVRGSLIRAHITLGLVGLVVGLVIAALLIGFGFRFAVSSPVATYSVAAAFGAIFGLLWGGFFSLRPDHGPLVTTVEDEVRKGRFAVVAHTHNRAEHKLASRALKEAAGRVITSV